MAIQLTLVGLGQIGASIGLALGEHKELVRRLGHDREPNRARKAEKMGALDQVSFNLPSAVRQADLIILAEAVDHNRETLRAISQDLKAGAVILDTSPLIVSNAEWALQNLPAERHYVGFTPTVNPDYLLDTGDGVDNAHADLFQNSLVAITSPAGTHSEAIKLASDLAGLLGGTPFFADMYETDGLLAANHVLPQVTAAALVHAAVDQPGWREGRKLAGQAFAQATLPVLNLDDAQALGQAFLLNQESVVRVIDDMIRELQQVRQAVHDKDQESLQEYLAEAVDGRNQWWSQRQKGDWVGEENPRVNAPTMGDFFNRLIGLGRRPDSQKKQK